MDDSRKTASSQYDTSIINYITVYNCQLIDIQILRGCESTLQTCTGLNQTEPLPWAGKVDTESHPYLEAVYD